MQAKLLGHEGRAGTWSIWVEKRKRHSKEFPELLFRIVPYIMRGLQFGVLQFYFVLFNIWVWTDRKRQ